MASVIDKARSTALALGIATAAISIFCLTGIAHHARSTGVAPVDALSYLCRASLADWPREYQLGSALALLGWLAAAGLLAVSMWGVRWTPRNRDLRSDDAAETLLSKGVAAPGARAGKNRLAIWVGKYAGKNFYVTEEDRGLVLGPPGTGKTNFLLNQILRAADQGLSFAAVDFKPEIHDLLRESLERKGYRVLRVNPAVVDAGADAWNPIAEIHDETTLAELCAALLPIRDPGEAPFVESQRDWLRAAVFHVKTQPGGSIVSAFNLLSSATDPAQLLAMFEASPSEAAARLARRLRAGLAGSKPDPLILSGFSGCLRGLDYLGLASVQAALSHSTIRVRDFGKGDQPVAWFLQFPEAKIQAIGPLLAFTGAALLSTLIDTAGQRAPVALFLDELGNMPAIPGLVQKLNTIRSRHIPTWMYTQTVAQLDERYGRGASAIFLASADLLMAFRINDEPTRELLSKLIGTHERRKQSTSSNRRDPSTQTRTTERVNTIEPHELGQLRPGEVVTLYRGGVARGRATPHYVDFKEFSRDPEIRAKALAKLARQRKA